MNEAGDGPRQVGELLNEATAALIGAGIPEPRREARIILAHALGVDQASLFGHPERVVDPVRAERFAALLARRRAREPWSRIVGVREFWSLPFRLSADTLDPRPDSETLIQAVLDALPNRNAALSVLDLGTGSGCLLLALLSELPRATGLGVDISPGAVATAAGNAQALGLADRARFVVGDWNKGVTGLFDVILINPPYIPDGAIDALEPEVARWEPRRALAGGADGLDVIRALAPDLPKLVAPRGLIAVELGAGQDDAAAAIFAAAGLAIFARPPDLSGEVRCLLMRPTGTG
jgi:release factor glutamine methyltransferase